MKSSKPFCLIISSPSGTGKSTICKMILANFSNFELSISMTTRKIREGEINSIDYHFVDKKFFEQKTQTDDYFLEWAIVFNNFYGTPKDKVETTLKEGKNVLFDIDWQGAEQIRKFQDIDVVSIFILPPSMNELSRRILNRTKQPAEDIEIRLKTASIEISKYNDYNYVVINDNLDDAFNEIKSIIISENNKRNKYMYIPKFVENLLQS